MLPLTCRVTLKHLLGPNILPSVTFLASIMSLKYMDAWGVLYNTDFSVYKATFCCSPLFSLLSSSSRKKMMYLVSFLKLFLCLAPQSLLHNCGYGEKLNQIPTASLLLVQCANLCLFTCGSESMFVSDAAVCVWEDSWARESQQPGWVVSPLLMVSPLSVPVCLMVH